jgi:hypothetical protein
VNRGVAVVAQLLAALVRSARESRAIDDQIWFIFCFWSASSFNSRSIQSGPRD